MGGIGGILAFAAGAYLYGLNRTLPFFAAAVCSSFWRARLSSGRSKSQKDSDTKAIEARPGLIQSLRVVLAEREKSALLLFLAIFSWFVGYNGV